MYVMIQLIQTVKYTMQINSPKLIQESGTVYNTPSRLIAPALECNGL